MPSAAFIGVRISWLMLARNSLLARVAASAASVARRSSTSARLRSVMSKKVTTPPTGSPSCSCGYAQYSTAKDEPSSRQKTWSSLCTPSPRHST